MINALLKGIMSLIMGLVKVVLSPIDLLIENSLPSLASGISAIGNMLAYASDMLGFVVSLTGLSSATLSLIVTYYTFKLTIPIGVSAVKTCIKWYNALKP